MSARVFVPLMLWTVVTLTAAMAGASTARADDGCRLLFSRRRLWCGF
jgi:hypothetical protein